MVTVVTRPQGHKIIDQAIEATITEQYGGDAIVTFPYHGLGTGDFVYITSDIDEYNGFWYVTTADVNTFKISEGATTDFVIYYQDADIEYYQTQEHDWSSIFLPIVYKCSNDLWPVNSSNPERTVSSFSDDNGFTSLVLSGALRSSLSALEFVIIDDEVWQIVEVISTSAIVINMPYDASTTFGTVQYYYNNYQVKVKVYAGLPSSHPWAAHKPYVEVAELSLTPDEDNQVMFSVSDYIKMKVAIKNNLTLFSLPLNLDAFTGFYISVAESFDQSDSYSLMTSESPFVDDTFEGFAIAGKLPFKNIYSGDYADYIYTSGSPALWLTNRERLLAVEGYFFDVSFIKNIVGDFYVTVLKYVGDYATTETLNFVDQGIGVYRIPITPDANYDSFCITVITESHTEIIEIPVTPEDLTTMTNEAAGGDLPDWTLGSTPFILGQTQSDNLSLAKVITSGSPFQVNYKILIENKSVGFASFQFESLTAALASVEQVSISSNTEGLYEGSFIFPATSNADLFTLTFSNASIWDMTLLELSFGTPTTEEVEVPGATVTEEICIDILETCESIDQFTQEARRLLEDGSYRLLE